MKLFRNISPIRRPGEAPSKCSPRAPIPNKEIESFLVQHKDQDSESSLNISVVKFSNEKRKKSIKTTQNLHSRNFEKILRSEEQSEIALRDNSCTLDKQNSIFSDNYQNNQTL